MPAKVLVAATVLREEEKLLVKAFREAGAKPQIYLPSDGARYLQQDLGEARVAMRRLSSQDALNEAQRLEAAGATCFNNSSAIATCSNKILQALLLTRHNINHPVSVCAFNPQDVYQFGETNGWPIVVKPPTGSWGRGVTRLTKDTFEVWAAAIEGIDPTFTKFPILAQKEIDKENFDIRVVVVGDRPIAAIKRHSAEFTTNTARGARIEAIELTPDLISSVLSVTKLLGPGFYGIDVLWDVCAKQYVPLEINSNPDFSKSMKIHGIDIPNAYVNWVLS